MIEDGGGPGGPGRTARRRRVAAGRRALDGRRDRRRVRAGGGDAGRRTAAARRAGPLLEQETEPASFVRIVGLHVRSLEIMAMRGLLDRLAQQGRGRPAGGFFAAIPAPAPEGADSPYDFLLGIPQPVVVRILEEHAIALGAQVRHGCAVAGLVQDDDGVTVELDGGERVRARYLVGCDGARSTVRKLLGVGFPGEPSRNDTLMGELELLSPGPGPEAVRRLLTGLMDIGEVNRRLTERITATGIRYALGEGPDLLGRRLPDIDTRQGRLYGLLHHGRGLLLDRTGRLTPGAWSDRVDHLADPGAAVDVPSLLLRPDGHVAWIGDAQHDLDTHLARWFGTPST